MSIMLNESNSSFDTTPSYDFILRRDDDRDDEVIVSDVDDDDGYDVVENEAERREEVGVLIVPPTSSSENSRNTVLSVPDSVPTVLNSGILQLPNSVHVVDDNGTSPYDRESLQLNDGEQYNCATILRDKKQEKTASIQNARRRNVLTILFFAAVSASSISHAIYLHRESQLLKNQVRLLEDQAVRAAATLKELQQQHDRDVVFGNCWLQAHGKMSLGECSFEATESVKAQVNTVSRSFQNMWDQLKVAYIDSVKGNVSTLGRFSDGAPINVTINSMSNKFQEIWTKIKYVCKGSIKERVNTTSNSVQEIWNAIKRRSNDIYIIEQVKSVPNKSHEMLDQIKELYDENIKENINFIGRSLYTVTTTLLDHVERGYRELKDSIQQEIVYNNSDHLQYIFTSSENSTDANSTNPYLSNISELQSLSKKLLVAALWSTGAAILVSTLDMYWNQHGKFLALEN
jgi:hypothetical protein